jgi:hypothetical protein
MPHAKRAAAKPRRKTASTAKRTSRKRAVSPRKPTSRAPAPAPAKRPRGRPRLAPFQSCTPEMEENIRQRYEETDEPVAAIAADRGVAPGSLRRIAYAKGWVRRKHRPPKDVTAAMRILAETERLEARVTPTPTLPLAGGGSPTERGEREQTESAAPSSPGLHLADIERLEAAVRKELGVIEAMRAAYGSEPYRPYHAQLTTRTLSNLTDTLGKLVRLRAALAQPLPAPTGFAHDDMPADIDEFRDALARRIEAFLESREAEADAERDGASVLDEAR